MKTEIIILAIWSAVMLQSGMLSTSYVTNVKSEPVQMQVMEQQAEETFLTYGSGEDLSGNETSLLTSMSNMEKKEAQESEVQDVQVKKIKEVKSEEAEQKEVQESEDTAPKQMKILKKKPAKQDKTEESVSDEKAKKEEERLAKEEAERLAKEEEERLAKEKAEAEAAARKLNTDPSTLTFLVNKEYVLPKNYIPKLVEPKVNHCQPTSSHKRYMREEAATALEEMFAAAKADGYDLWVKTAYRSYSNQYSTYTWTLQYRGEKEAVSYHAFPGASEHQTGLAVDIVCEASNYENDLSFEKTKECAWLKENCYKYGFTLRYWEGKEHITGYNYEPWHYRYVGVELATYLMEQELTLEEYYNALPTTDLFQVPEEYRYLIQDKTESK